LIRHAASRYLVAAIAWVHIVSIGHAADDASFLVAGPDERPQVFADLAFTPGKSGLLVWQQGLNYFEQQDGDIYARRVNAAGQPAEGEPIALARADGSQERPRIASSGERFLVVWQDLRNGRDWDVYGRRVGDDGRLFDTSPILIAGGDGNQAGALVAAAASGWIVVWQHYDGRYYALHAARLNLEGRVEWKGALQYRGEPLRGGSPTLASTGAGWLLSWLDELAWEKGLPGMITRRFASLAADGPGLAVESVERSPAVTLGRRNGVAAGTVAGGAAFVGWGDVGRGRQVPMGAVFAARSAMALANPNQEPAQSMSGWDPAKVFMLFSPHRQVFGPLAIAAGEHGYLVAGLMRGVRPNENAAPYRIVATAFSATGKRAAEFDRQPTLHESTAPLSRPVLAGVGGGYVLVYEQDDGPGLHRLWSRQVRLK
jgi:hypothetical protein